MGILEVESSSEGAPEDQQTVGERANQGAAPESAAEHEEAHEDPHANKRIDITPQKPGRRAQAEEHNRKLLERLDAISQKFETSTKTLEERIAQRDREIAELRGSMGAFQQQIHAPAPPPQQAAGPSPEELLDKANACLDKGDMRGYHKHLRESILAEQRQNAPQPPQFQPQPQVDPRLYVFMAQHPEVAQHPRGLDMVQAHARLLQAQGMYPDGGPELVKAAFAAANEALKKPNTPAPSAASRAAAAGAPAQRASGGGSGRTTFDLTPEERQIAKEFGIPEERFAAQLARQPEHRGRVRRE